MIALASDCLVFQLTSGENIPFCAEMISVELLGDTAGLFDADFVRHAAHAVFHFFKQELGRQRVTVVEFAQALEKVLRGFALSSNKQKQRSMQIAESDLRQLASESGKGCELFFFPRLRSELRQHLRHAPQMVRFRGLRGCVKQLTGVRRWTLRCRSLEEQIVEYLRACLNTEPSPKDLSLVVE